MQHHMHMMGHAECPCRYAAPLTADGNSHLSASHWLWTSPTTASLMPGAACCAAAAAARRAAAICWWRAAGLRGGGARRTGGGRRAGTESAAGRRAGFAGGTLTDLQTVAGAGQAAGNSTGCHAVGRWRWGAHWTAGYAHLAVQVIDARARCRTEVLAATWSSLATGMSPFADRPPPLEELEKLDECSGGPQLSRLGRLRVTQHGGSLHACRSGALDCPLIARCLLHSQMTTT